MRSDQNRHQTNQSEINAIWDEKTKKIIVQKKMPHINCLALEGCGARGVAYSGLYHVLQRYGFMDGIEHISGSSAGALAALMMSLNYTPEETEETLLTMDMESFLEGYHKWVSSSNWLYRGRAILKVLNDKCHSLVTGNVFLNWLDALVEKKLGKKEATFSDLAKKIEEQKDKGKQAFKYLYVTGTNLSLEVPECVYFSHETTPNMPLALAVRISGSFTCVFQSKEWENATYSDGGLIYNLPTSIFDHRRFFPSGQDFNDSGAPTNVLAVKVDSQAEIDQVIWGIKKKVKLETTTEFGTALYNATTNTIDTQKVRESKLVLALPDNEIGTLQFTISRKDKLRLIRLAEIETENFLENYCHAAYDVKTFPDLKSWFDQMPLEDVNDVRRKFEEALQNEHHDIEKLNKAIAYTKKYIVCRLNYNQNSEAISNEIPELPVNLIPQNDKGNWNELVVMAMEFKYKNISQQILNTIALAKEYQYVYDCLPQPEEIKCLHDETYYGNIQAITLLNEKVKTLKDEKKELALKLNLNEELPQYPREDAIQYQNFRQALCDILVKKSDKKLYKEILFMQPVLKFESNAEKNSIFLFDFYHSLDRKIYLLAIRYFLSTTHAIGQRHFTQIYQDYVSDNVMLPKNFMELSEVLNLRDKQLGVAACRLEELIHFLQTKSYLGNKPSILLDEIFGLKKQLPNSEIEMQHYIYSHSIFANKPKTALQLNTVSESSLHL